jgi:hypothetical protein
MKVLLLNAGSSSLKASLVESFDGKVLARGLTDYRGQLRLWDSATVQVGDGLVGNTVSAAFGTDRISRLKGGRGDRLRHRFEPGIDAERGSEARRQIDDGRLVFD